MKRIASIEPYIYNSGCNFKHKPWVAWKNVGGKTCHCSYPRCMHKLLFSGDFIPSIYELSSTARICFAAPASLYFDTWSSVAFHEVIPFLWDCWEEYDELLCNWLKRHNIKTCIFTSEISRNRIVGKLPCLKTFVVTEGIEVTDYPRGKELKNRTIDYYSFGRIPKHVQGLDYGKLNVAFNGSDEELKAHLQNAKVTIAVPRCDVVNGCHETLTQRYWECMLSRMVMVGRSPKELTDLIGYDPVIPVDYDNFVDQVKDIVAHVSDYQSLVDKNREVALRMAPWEIRMKQVMEWLESLGYQI